MTENFFKRFKDIDEDYLDSEMHCHTTWTDGRSSVSDIVDKAESIGLKRLIFTDHVRRQSNYFSEYNSEIRKLNKNKEIEILVGLEAKVADFEGNLDLSQECKEMADIVIGTVHSFPLGNTFVHPKEMNFNEIAETEYKLLLGAIERGEQDIIGHVGGMSIVVTGNFPLEYMEEIIKKCSDTGTIFEINSRYHVSIIDWMFEKLVEYNPFISIASDAHDIIDIGNCSKLLSNAFLKGEKCIKN